jgi:hypothetical protein
MRPREDMTIGLRWCLSAVLLLAAAPGSAESILEKAGAVTLRPGARVATSPGFAYVAGPNGTTLDVIDVATPIQPTLCGTVPNFYANDIATLGRYVVATRGGSLVVLDAVNPCAPVMVGSLPLSGAFRIAIAGRFAYVLVTGGVAGALVIVDLAEPTAPVERGRVPVSAHPADLDVSGGRVYVADRASGLRIIDVGNPSAPVQLVGRSVGRPGQEAWGVAVSGTYAYVTVHGMNAHYGIPLSGDILVLDVYDDNPVLVGSIASPVAPEEITVSGSYAYVIEDDIDFYAGQEQLRVYDVSDPFLPALVASRWAGFAERAVVSGSSVFTTSVNVFGGGPSEFVVLRAFRPPVVP